MPLPYRENLVLHDTTDVTIPLTIQNNSGIPLDITGYSFELEIAENAADTSAILTVAGTITSAPNGEMEFVITDTQLAGWTAERAKYQMRMTDPSGLISVIMEGLVVWLVWGVA